MPQRIIKTQAQLNKLTEVKVDEIVTIDSSKELTLKSTITVFGILRVDSPVQMSPTKYIKAYNNSTVTAYNSATVVAWDDSTVTAYGWSIVRYRPSVKLEMKSDFATAVERKQVFKTKRKTTVYKKLNEGAIATLELKKGQVFQSENHSKCRTDSAKVVAIEKDGKQLDVGYSAYDKTFKYEVGKTVSADYDEAIDECSTGIHFFITRLEAENY